MDAALKQLAELCGIATEFHNWKGQLVAVDEQTVKAALSALGVTADSSDAVADSVQQLTDKPWRTMLPPAVVMTSGDVVTVTAHVHDGRPAEVTVELEDGGEIKPRQIDNFSPARLIGGVWVGEASFELPADLPLGYHLLRIVSDEHRAASSLIVTPAHLGLPERARKSRIWGYSAQLYSVRSKQSWGVGDFADLTSLSVWSAVRQNCDYVLINPVHAENPLPPMEPSPYLPASRIFLNPMYIRPEYILEFSELPVKKQKEIHKLFTRLDNQISKQEFIERDLSWAAKKEALKIIWAAGRNESREIMFEAFKREQGLLRDFAVWSVLSEYYGPHWHEWPKDLQDPDSDRVDVFYAAHTDEVDFVEWLQWVASMQRGSAQQAALDAGMKVGLVNDLAVGVGMESADVWMRSDLHADGMRVGAPPDSYNQLGQDWGQPPWRPDRLAESGYAPFRAMVRNVLTHAGGVRIDHIIGLFRLWWIPAGCSPDKGTYVRYDHEALVGILVLEAHRAGAMVVGEDLGTVEPWVREYLAARGILGSSVLWFERDGGGNLLPPQHWRELCMASVGTHDLPPAAGYIAKAHVELRARLNLLAGSVEAENQRADSELLQWHDYLQAHGAFAANEKIVASDDVAAAEKMVLGLYRALTWSNSRVLNVMLTDAVGDVRIQNQPGTVNEYPNWRVPLGDGNGSPLMLEDLYTMERPMRLAAVMRDIKK